MITMLNYTISSMLATSSCNSNGSVPRFSIDNHSLSIRSRTVFVDFSSKIVGALGRACSLAGFTATNVMFDVSSDALSRYREL